MGEMVLHSLGTVQPLIPFDGLIAEASLLTGFADEELFFGRLHIGLPVRRQGHSLCRSDGRSLA